MKHKCSRCGNKLFEIIVDKKYNEVWIVCQKCGLNSEIRIPVDTDDIEETLKIIKSIKCVHKPNPDAILMQRVCIEEVEKLLKKVKESKNEKRNQGN